LVMSPFIASPQRNIHNSPVSHKTFGFVPFSIERIFYCNDFNLIHFSSNFIHKKVVYVLVICYNILLVITSGQINSNEELWKPKKGTLVLNNVIMVSWVLFHGEVLMGLKGVKAMSCCFKRPKCKFWH
jgi:hypothetical protein